MMQRIVQLVVGLGEVGYVGQEAASGKAALGHTQSWLLHDTCLPPVCTLGEALCLSQSHLHQDSVLYYSTGTTEQEDRRCVRCSVELYPRLRMHLVQLMVCQRTAAVEATKGPEILYSLESVG